MHRTREFLNSDTTDGSFIMASFEHEDKSEVFESDLQIHDGKNTVSFNLCTLLGSAESSLEVKSILSNIICICSELLNGLEEAEANYRGDAAQPEQRQKRKYTKRKKEEDEEEENVDSSATTSEVL